MILEFKQTTTSPCVSTVFLNDTEVGHITTGAGCKIVERCQYDHTAPVWDAGRHQFSTLKDAKRHLVRKIRDVYPGLDKQ